MMTRSKLIYFLTCAFSLTNTGCIVNGGWNWGDPNVWTPKSTQQLPIDTANLKSLKVRTNNGSIKFVGQTADTAEAYVSVTKKGGGITSADAEDALEAIDAYIEPAGDGTQRIAWRWKGVKHSTWHAQVSYEIHAPRNINLDGATDFGPIDVNGLDGKLTVVTHNGKVRIASVEGGVHADSSFGSIRINNAIGDTHVVTSNGAIEVNDLTGGLEASSGFGSIKVTDINGDCRLATSNGAVTVTSVEGGVRADSKFGSLEIIDVTGDVRAVTNNGRIKVQSTGGKLDVRTSFGEISADYNGDDITLSTANGAVRADLTKCSVVDGKLSSSFGRVEVKVAELASVKLNCRTGFGSINCDVPLNNSRVSRGRLTGTIGTGEGNLDVSTHNGSIRIKGSG